MEYTAKYDKDTIHRIHKEYVLTVFPDEPAFVPGYGRTISIDGAAFGIIEAIQMYKGCPSYRKVIDLLMPDMEKLISYTREYYKHLQT